MMPHMHIVGIAKLSPGTLFSGVVTTWDAQERLLWACFKYADDVASLHVLDYARLLEPRRVEAYMQSFGATQMVHLHQVSHRVADGI